jgi:hypothetical protein
VHQKILFKSHAEDGFRKKAETCSCYDVLIIFKHMFYAIKVVLDSQVIYSVEGICCIVRCDAV